jgi:small subunit ribosomal protein S16
LMKLLRLRSQMPSNNWSKQVELFTHNYDRIGVCRRYCGRKFSNFKCLQGWSSDQPFYLSARPLYLPFSTAFDSIQPMLKIRLQRVGRKHEPSFRLVLTDSKNGPKSGKYQEVLGHFDTRRDNKAEQFDLARVKHWMGMGAQVSDTVHNFLVEKKIIEGKKVNKLPRKSPIKKEEAKAEGDKKATAAPAAAAEAKVETAPEKKAEAKPEAVAAPAV